MTTIKERKKLAIQADHVLEPRFPREILVDLTSYCNHTCNFCSNPRLRHNSTMGLDMAKRVLREAYDLGTRDVGLYGTGESFVVRNLHDYVAAAKAIGYEYVYITTNGAIATPDRAKKVLDAGLDSVKFSISAGKRETYKQIQGKDDFDKVVANLRWIAQYRQDTGLSYRIYVTMVYTDVTKDEVDILEKLVLPYVDEWDPHTLTNQCGNKSDNNSLGFIEQSNIRGRVKSEICFQPFTSFTVTPEGYVSGCVVDYQRTLIVGDLNRSTLAEIWHNEVYKSWRQRHIDGSVRGSICYNCIYNADEPITPLMPEYAEALKGYDSTSFIQIDSIG